MQPPPAKRARTDADGHLAERERERECKELKASHNAYYYEQVVRLEYGHLHDDMACSVADVGLESLDEDEKGFAPRPRPTGERPRSSRDDLTALETLMAGARKKAPRAAPSKVSDLSDEGSVDVSDDERARQGVPLDEAPWTQEDYRLYLAWVRRKDTERT